MNGKKAKAIRRLFKDQLYDKDGRYKTTADLRVGKEGKKMVHYIDPETKLPKTETVKRVVVINANKYKYRLDKRAYLNGDFTI